MDRPELWRRARDDAGFTDETAVWREIPGLPDDEIGGTWVVSVGPGRDIDPRVLPPEGDLLSWASDNRDRVRVISYAGVTEPAALGLLRWALEYARLDRDQTAAMQLIRVVHVAHQDRIRRAGAGGARYHHMAPEQRQSNAAASRLVERLFGQQLGELGGTFGSLFSSSPFGPIFRNAGEFMEDSVFGRRAVAFAAFHSEDIARYEAEGRVHVAPFVERVDPSATDWWNTLLQDDDFSRLKAAAPVVVPTPEATAAAESARWLWQTPAELYERAEARALEVLGPAA
jgi:hypothetical protein